MRIVELSRPGMVYAARLHAAGCRDVTLDKRRGYVDSYVFDGTVDEWKEQMFGDVALDHADPNDEAAWRDEIELQAGEVTVCGCLRGGLSDSSAQG